MAPKVRILGAIFIIKLEITAGDSSNSTLLKYVTEYSDSALNELQ